jgi:hypothetical protein
MYVIPQKTVTFWHAENTGGTIDFPLDIRLPLIFEVIWLSLIKAMEV